MNNLYNQKYLKHFFEKNDLASFIIIGTYGYYFINMNNVISLLPRHYISIHTSLYFIILQISQTLPTTTTYTYNIVWYFI